MTPSFGDRDHQFGFHDQSPSGWDFAELLTALGQSIFSGHSGHGTVQGTPETDTPDWVQQSTPFTCDVVSQEMILHWLKHGRQNAVTQQVFFLTRRITALLVGDGLSLRTDGKIEQSF